jgi:hypothetical protein
MSSSLDIEALKLPHALGATPGRLPQNNRSGAAYPNYVILLNINHLTTNLDFFVYIQENNKVLVIEIYSSEPTDTAQSKFVI